MKSYAIILQDTKTRKTYAVIVNGTSIEDAQKNLESKSDYLDKYAIISTTLVIDTIL